MVYFGFFDRNMKLADAMAYLEGLMDDEVDPRDNIEVVLEPPDENELSGEDSGDEFGGGYIDNVSVRQLKGSCEVRFISHSPTMKMGSHWSHRKMRCPECWHRNDSCE